MTKQDPDALDALRRLPTATVSDCLGRFQAMDGAIRRLSGGDIAGPAWTAMTVAGDSRTLHHAVASAPSGSVLVVDAGAHLGRAVWGDVLAQAAQRAGIVGVVLDGAVRDVAALRARGFPAYARGTCPAGPHKGGDGPVGAPIQCGGVVINPGDVVLADEDGVVVVPLEMVATVPQLVAERTAMEQRWMDRIEQGESTVSIFDLT